jgi:hypothetical protein
MANRYYTGDEVRAALDRALKTRTQSAICRECGCKPQHISIMVKGGPITGKVLAWLGFTRVDGLYRRRA